MDIAIYSILLIAAIAFIADPLVRRGRRQRQRSEPVQRETEIQAEKAAAYEALSDLEFEYKTGKLSDQHYRELRDGYRARALHLLAASDELSVKAGGEVPCLQCAHANLPGSRSCAVCGHELAATERTCDRCGTVARSEARFCAVCGHPIAVA
jgi:RNA polymerase subunit RPABC4/transcription elongation factor Spt4